MTPYVEIAELDAVAQAELVRRGEVRPDELVEAALAAIDTIDPSLNAVVARVAPLEAQPGPFSGVPFLVKDLLVEVAGTVHTEGSRWLAGNVSAHDSELVARYRRAGLVIVGKANTCEFGLSPTCESALLGPACNPWDPSRSTGGSSGGSAAAVAAGLVPMAHGNDAGGSLRYPAAWCGVFGFKPTRARVTAAPLYGDLVGGLCAENAVTRSVRDAAALLDAVHGPAPGDPYAVPSPHRPYLAEVTTDPGRLRIAVCTRPRSGRQVSRAWRAAAEGAAATLEELGHEVTEGVPDGLDDPGYDEALGTVFGAGAGWLVSRWRRRLRRGPDDGDLEPQTRAYVERAMRITAVDYLLALEVLQRVSRRVALWFASHDAWLTPTLGTAPPPLGELVGTETDPLRGSDNAGRHLMFDAELANVTGNPAMSVPFGFDDDGLPLGVHVLGRFGDEATMFRLAAQLEQARPWPARRPVVAAVP